MDAHPVPQNVTSFQFRLIGDMTLKQFGYLGSGVGFAYLMFVFLAPAAPFVAYPIIVLSSFLGIAFAFIPIQERPLDHWVAAFLKAVYHPTKREWRKNGKKASEDPSFKNRLNVYLTVKQAMAMPLISETASVPAPQLPDDVLPNIVKPPATPLPVNPLPSLVEKPILADKSKEVTPLQVAPAPSAAPAPDPKPIASTPLPETQPAITTNPVTPLPPTPTLAPAPAPIRKPLTPITAYTTPPSPTPTQPLPVIQPVASPPPPPPPPQPVAAPRPITTPLSAPAPAPAISSVPAPLPRQAPVIAPQPMIQPEVASKPQIPEIPQPLPSPEELSKTVELGQKAQALQVKIIETEKELSRIKTQATSIGVDPKAYTQQFNTIFDNLQKLVGEASLIKKQLEAVTNEPQVAPKAAVKVEVITPKPKMTPITLTSVPNVINGIVHDQGGNYLDGVVVVIHDKDGLPVRALKTNKLGQFTGSTPLPNGVYNVELEKDNYVFDVLQMTLDGKVLQPVMVSAKSVVGVS